MLFQGLGVFLRDERLRLLLNKNYSSKEEKEALVKQVKELLEPYAEEMMKVKELQASNRCLEEGIKQLQKSNQRWREKMARERAATKHLQKEMKEVHACKVSLLDQVSSLNQRAEKLLDGDANASEEDAKQWLSKRALLPQCRYLLQKR